MYRYLFQNTLFSYSEIIRVPPVSKNKIITEEDVKEHIQRWNKEMKELKYSQKSIFWFVKVRVHIKNVLKNLKKLVEGKKAFNINPEYHFNKAYSYAKSGEYEKAIEYFSKVIEIDPSNADAYYERSECYEKLGEHQKAIADRAKIKELE